MTSDDCILWTGAIQSAGYGHRWIGNGKTALVHRLAWEEVNGIIPDGMTIDHLCEVRNCINVEHMEIVSRGDNVRRYYANRAHLPEGQRR